MENNVKFKSAKYKRKKCIKTKGMYNGAILGVPRRINDEVEERELIRKGLSSLI